MSVTITGVTGEPRSNVERFLSIRQAQSNDDVPTPFTIRRLHEMAPEEIRQALMPFGYYSPEIDSELAQVDREWRATYSIDVGAATRISELDIRLPNIVGELPDVRQRLQDSVIQQGAVLNHAAYSRLKLGIQQSAISLGYLDASWTESQIRVDPARREALITLHLDVGARFYFGRIDLQQDALDQSFAERFILIKEGEPFSTDQLVALQFALSDSGYFQNVTIDASREDAIDHRIPIVVQADTRLSQRYSARAGVGTDTGPRFRLGTEFRRLSGRGTTFRSDLQVSTIKTTATAQYSIPIKNVAIDRQTFSGRFDRAEIGDTDSDLYSLGARRYDRWKGLGRQLYLEFENEQFALGDAEDARSELLIVGASLAWKKVDDALFTRRGLSARLDVHGAHKSVLSDTSFVQASLATRFILPLGDRTRLLLRGDIGMTEVDDLTRLPPSQRFFSGGDRTVRGYGFESLSPLDAEGASVGGRYLLGASVEADYFFNDKYGIAAFFDHGGAVNSLGDALRSGVGLGFRYRTPIGVLRIDGAHALNDLGDAFRLHVSLGPDL
ncbi:MAG: outer membrane protein assembly factor [Pseudomonadota bacterium]